MGKLNQLVDAAGLRPQMAGVCRLVQLSILRPESRGKERTHMSFGFF